MNPIGLDWSRKFFSPLCPRGPYPLGVGGQLQINSSGANPTIVGQYNAAIANQNSLASQLSGANSAYTADTAAFNTASAAYKAQLATNASNKALTDAQAAQAAADNAASRVFSATAFVDIPGDIQTALYANMPSYVSRTEDNAWKWWRTGGWDSNGEPWTPGWSPSIDEIRNRLSLSGQPFDDARYKRLHPEVAASGMDPLTHFVNVGIPDGLKFAAGGVFDGPTVINVAGRAGVMAEAGPEAVMPLTRVGGKLGVHVTNDNRTDLKEVATAIKGMNSLQSSTVNVLVAGFGELVRQNEELRAEIAEMKRFQRRARANG
ncbi:MAG: hypothetical protein WCJ64_08740 [Rhodospirillaceae bacterium]